MTTATLARKMSDGTICRTGPTCKRHGGKGIQGQVPTTVEKQLQQAQQAVAEKIKALPLPKGSVRESQNAVNPDWSKPIYDMSREVEKNFTDREDHAVRFYKTGGYIEINGYLRDGDEGYPLYYRKVYAEHPNESRRAKAIAENLEKIKEISGHLDEAFKHEVDLPENTLLYRGVIIENPIPAGKTVLQHMKGTYSVGSVISEKGFVSTSADPDYMSFFGRKRIKAKGQHMVFEIVAKKGLPVVHEDISTKNPHPHRLQESSIQYFEREILLNRGTQFRVVGVKNVTFKHSYDKVLNGGGMFVRQCPQQVTYPVVQLDQL